jgi:hypothetical protein
LNDLDTLVGKLLDEVGIGSTARSPELDLGQGSLGSALALFIFPLNSINNSVGP